MNTTSGWLDPPQPPPHECSMPLVWRMRRHAGRRWKCACGQIWVIERRTYSGDYEWQKR